MFQVWPITTFPVRAINDNSVRLVEAAKRAHPIERQLNQVSLLILLTFSIVLFLLKKILTMSLCGCLSYIYFHTVY